MPSIGKPLIVILGATAVGKTVLGIELAQAIGGEIIGADSRQVYRYMDIGTAKPTAKEQAQAPHHLIDIINPDTPFTLAEYQALAYQHIDEIHSRESSSDLSWRYRTIYHSCHRRLVNPTRTTQLGYS